MWAVIENKPEMTGKGANKTNKTYEKLSLIPQIQGNLKSTILWIETGLQTKYNIHQNFIGL